MRIAFGVVSVIALLIILYSMGDLFFKWRIDSLDFQFATTNMIFAIGLVVISGMVAVVREIIELRKVLENN